MRQISFSDINPDVKGVLESIVSVNENTLHYSKRSYTHRLMIVRKGSCRFHMRGRTLDCETGCVLYFPPFETYTTEFLSDSFEVVNIFFDFIPYRGDSTVYTDIIIGDDYKSEFMGEKLSFSDMNLFEAPFLVSGIADAVEKASIVSRELRERRNCYKLRCRAILLETLVLMYRRASAPEKSDGETPVDLILTYINDNCERKLDRESLGRELNYHPSHINRLVYSATGMTLHRYIIDTKIRRAGRLLSATDLTVTEIAQRLSFYDSSHFASVFSSVTGTSPSDYRKASRELE